MTAKGMGTATNLDQTAGEAPVAEPSMDEILASIRAIIADDKPDDGLTARERYTHPTDVSNANVPTPEVGTNKATAQAASPNEAKDETTPGSTTSLTPGSTAGLPHTKTSGRAAMRAQITPADRTADLRARADALKAEISAGAKQPLTQTAPTETSPPAADSVTPTPTETEASEARDNASEDNANADSTDADVLEIERLANALRDRERQAVHQPAPAAQAAAAPASPSVAAATFAAAPSMAQPSPNQPEFAKASFAQPSVAQSNFAQPSVAQPETAEIADAVAQMMLDAHGDELKASIQDMMTPVIRKWLGDNLPTMVERLVRDEIERAARGNG